MEKYGLTIISIEKTFLGDLFNNHVSIFNTYKSELII